MIYKNEAVSKMKKIFSAMLLGFITISLVFYFFTIQIFQFVEMTKMKLHGVKLHDASEYQYFEKNNCEDLKNCQCVLLLHGLGDFALTWEKMMTMDKSAYVKGVHFFAPNLTISKDHRLKELQDYNIQKYAMRISDYFLPKCNSWVIVGNSFGAWMSIFMSLKNDSVKALVLLGPAGLKKDYSHITRYFLNPNIESARDFYHKIYFKTYNVPDFIFKRIVERAKNQTVVEQLKSITDDDYLEKYLKHIKVPVEYVWGKADRVIPPTWGSEFHELTPGSSLDVIKGCGHVLQKECPDQAVIKLNEVLTHLNYQ